MFRRFVVVTYHSLVARRTGSGIEKMSGGSAQQNGRYHDRYREFTLLHGLLQFEDERTSHLKYEGRMQLATRKSNEGWLHTIFVWEGRALDMIFLPFCISVSHAIAYTVVIQIIFKVKYRDMTDWEIFFTLVLNTTLSFLLVFRLNRAADRYWTSRYLWGILIAKARSFLSISVTHGRHDRLKRDDAIRWVVAFVISSMELLRGTSSIPSVCLSGVLSEEEVRKLEKNVHPPIFALDNARAAARDLFDVDADTPNSLAFLRTRHYDSVERQMNAMLDCTGGLERIQSTPLPMVYVSHLRTFLLAALIMLPYLWGPSWGWTTIPIVVVTSFAWLGIDGAASEAEAPFKASRVNALDMNGYCLGFLGIVKQSLLHDAEQELSKME